ncbi:DEAD/DEAH box helicase family protein [bacterium]|nr:DEAD/DEAH box helicase family protein [candidate division CSSED10-310 bacterium]
MKLDTYINERTAVRIRDAIREAGGNEVFFAGYIPDGRKEIEEVQVLARGNETAVPVVLEAAHKAQVVIHNHPGGRLRPSNADLEIAALLGQSGIGFLIVDNEVSELYEVVPVVVTREKAPLEPAEVLALLAPQGPVAAGLVGFETRPEQRVMLEAVVEAFNRDGLAIIEAGTGTGKSLAYLIPAMLWATRNKERCVVSTNTINLQEQLISKDIPFVNRVLNLNARFCLVKGRTNYLCLQKLHSIRSEPDAQLEEDEAADFQHILEWAGHTEDGSKSDLGQAPNQRIWEKVCSEADTCLFLKCPHYGQCFLFKARRRAASADLLVVNHHLLFSDLAIRRSANNFNATALLPPYRRIILDEAHNAEDAASSYFGEQLTKLGLVRLLRKLYHRRRTGGDRGLLPLLLHRTSGTPQHPLIAEVISRDVMPYLIGLFEEVDQSFLGFFDFVRERGDTSDSDRKIRLVPAVIESMDWDEMVRLPLLELGDALAHLYKLLKPLDAALSEVEDESLDFDILQFRSTRQRLINWVGVLKTIIGYQEDGLVRWCEASTGTKWEFARLLFSPLEVGETMKETMYDNFPSVVFTSATLTSGNEFTFIKQRLGIDKVTDRPVRELALPSSFDFAEQVLLCIPTDVPNPNSREYSDALTAHAMELLRVSGGSAFLLFTSFAMLNRTFRALEGPLRELNITPLRQGDEDRHRMFERFREDITSTLFGTDSFWEGVDAPGETLRMVILTKLPFRVPTEPLVEARVEAIEKRGGNAFMEFTVPQAVIKFKQGFGRLIRKHDDRGVIVVYDNRVIKKFYGKLFLRSLPPCGMAVGPFNEVLRAVAAFFQGDFIE